MVQSENYITAYGQIVAIFEKKSSGEEEMHYVYTDHLGSLNIITNSTGAIVNEMSFDAWGNRRNPATWQLLPSNGGVGGGFITTRGFTGHEHMDAFGLINMNGRLYDPALGRFLSPDPFIANPTSTQDFNRYSYVVNNPLMFTDPSGYYLMAQYDGRTNDDARPWSVSGSIFPRMGEMGSPRDNLAYDLALATNWGNATGDYSSIGAVKDGVARGAYYGSGVTSYKRGLDFDEVSFSKGKIYIHYVSWDVPTVSKAKFDGDEKEYQLGPGVVACWKSIDLSKLYEDFSGISFTEKTKLPPQVIPIPHVGKFEITYSLSVKKGDGKINITSTNGVISGSSIKEGPISLKFNASGVINGVDVGNLSFDESDWSYSTGYTINGPVSTTISISFTPDKDLGTLITRSGAIAVFTKLVQYGVRYIPVY